MRWVKDGHWKPRMAEMLVAGILLIGILIGYAIAVAASQRPD